MFFTGTDGQEENKITAIATATVGHFTFVPALSNGMGKRIFSFSLLRRGKQFLSGKGAGNVGRKIF